MSSFLRIILATTFWLLQTTIANAEEARTKAAEGKFSYISVGTVGEVRGPFDEWVLWKTTSGYELETDLHMQGHPQISVGREILYLSEAFHIDGFKIFAFPWDPPATGSYSCRLQPPPGTRRVHCDYSLHNQTGGGNVGVPEPYSFDISIKPLEEDEPLDLPFGFASLVLSAPRDEKQSRTIPLVYLRVRNADDGDPKHVTIRAERTDIIKVRYAGRELIQILQKPIDALKFELNGTFTVWTAVNGMPLAIQHMRAARRWELTRFRQYEKFVPELD